MREREGGRALGGRACNVAEFKFCLGNRRIIAASTARSQALRAAHIRRNTLLRNVPCASSRPRAKLAPRERREMANLFLFAARARFALPCVSRGSNMIEREPGQ